MSANFQFVLVDQHHEDPHAAAKRAQRSKIDEYVANHKTWLPKAAEGIMAYQMYVETLADRLPGSYDRLKRFLESGSCTCCKGKGNEAMLCSCADEGGKCTCPTNDWKRKKSVCKACSEFVNGVPDCKTTRIDDVVRVYEINPEAARWKDFLKVHSYAVSKDDEFAALQERLDSPLFENEDDDDVDRDEGVKSSHDKEKKSQHSTTFRHSVSNITKLPDNVEQVESDVVTSTISDEATLAVESERDKQNGNVFDHYIPEKPCRIITVSHLSSNVAKLLGSKFKISADFFNRHLPGTEAISGRLISRLPSATQIDLDELYESQNTFEEIWGTNDPVKYGHHIINRAIKEHFRFPVGWDYFPISADDFEDSKSNVAMKSGYEVLLRDSSEDEVKNLFQFNLNHRISVYSNPPNHPRTVIIIFYPTLPIHLPPHLQKQPAKNITDNHMERVLRPFTSQLKGLFFKNMIYWLSLPKPIEEEPVEPAHGRSECEFHKQEHLRFCSIPNDIPTPTQLDCLLYDEDDDPDLKGWEESKQKQSLASVYNFNLKWHLKGHFKKLRSRRNGFRRQLGDDRFTHIFAFPLYSMVSAYWARLVIRRNFDLDLLEWRSKDHLTSTTIEETKSRRVAITRHIRNISTSLSTLRGLMLAEKGSNPDDHDTTPAWNVAHARGLVPNQSDDDSWQRVYGDFAELQTSMNALETRASRIHDSMVGLLSIVNNEQTSKTTKSAGRLNAMGAVFGIVILPFTLIPAYYAKPDYPTDDTERAHRDDLRSKICNAVGAFAGIWIAILLIYILIWEPLGSLWWESLRVFHRRERAGKFKRREAKAEAWVKKKQAPEKEEV